MSTNEGPEVTKPLCSRRQLAWLVTLAALVAPLAWLGARWDWRFDLLTHFQEPAAALSLLAALLHGRKRPWPALALTALTLWQVSPILARALPNPVVAAPQDPARLRVLMANVLATNSRYDLLAELIRREQPDVVALVEVNDAWIAGLDAIRREFPHRVELPIGTSGLALWFREPPESIDPPTELMPGTNPYLRATVRIGKRPTDLWLVHPTNPLADRARRHGNPELAALADRIAEQAQGRSTLVCGDLNCTDGSPHFQSFLRRTSLRDSRLGFGTQASWPSWLPYRIAIDHAFLSDDLAVVDRRIGPTISSDHLPIILDVAPAASSPSSATN